MGYGIIIASLSGADSFNGSTTIDIDLDVGETASLDFDLDLQESGFSPEDLGTYSVGPVPIGEVQNLDSSAGTFTWEFDQADWVAAGQPASVILQLFNTEATAFRQIDVNITCFAAGSLIATPTGEVAVETLKIGDVIRTADGGDVAVKWMGVQTVSTIFTPPERLRLIRFAAGSLGDGLPHSDLTVTTDHAMLVGGVLCNASAMVNGTTITRVPLAEMGADYTVYHIETEAHEIILANGAPAETFIDNVSRRVFDNYAEYQALYGEEIEMQELPLPRATSARQLPGSLRQKRVA